LAEHLKQSFPGVHATAGRIDGELLDGDLEEELDGELLG